MARAPQLACLLVLAQQLVFGVQWVTGAQTAPGPAQVMVTVWVQPVQVQARVKRWVQALAVLEGARLSVAERPVVAKEW